MATAVKPKTKTQTSGAKTPPPSRPKTGVAAMPPMELPDRIAWYSLHALIVFVALGMSNLTMSALFPNSPLFGGLPFTYDQFDIIKVFLMRFFTLIAFGGWTWGVLTRGGKLRTNKQLWVVLAFLGWVALSTMLSIHPATALFGKYRRFEGLVSFVNYAGVLFLAIQYADRPSRIRSLVRSVVFAGAAVAVYGILQFLGLDPIDWATLPFEARRAFSTYGNPDLLGGFLMFPLPLALALALSEDDRRWRTWYWTAFLLLGACWFVAYVRGAWIGGFVGLALLVFAAWRAKAGLKPVDKAFLIAIVVLAVALTAISVQSGNEVTNIVKRLASIFEFQSGSGQTRTQIWQAAIDAIKDRPLQGFGPDTFRLVFPKYKPAEYVAAAGYLSVADNVHNYPLQLTAGVGIPGFLLLYGFFIWSLVASGKTALARERGGERLLYAGVWCSVVAYLVHLMFGLSVTGSTVFLWLMLGILLAPFARTVDFKAPSWGPAVAFAAVLLVVAGLVGNFVYVSADRAYLLGRVRDQGQTRIDSIQRAIRLNPFNDMYRAELGLAYQDLTVAYLQQAQQAQQAGQTEQMQEALSSATVSFSDAEAAMRDVIRFVPPEYDNYVFLTSLYNLGAQYFDKAYWEEAIKIAEKGIGVEPFGPAIRYQQAQAYVGVGQNEKALEQLKVASDLDPRYVEPRILTADIYARQGRYREAKTIYSEALKTDLGWRKPQVEQSLAAVEASLAAKGE